MDPNLAIPTKKFADGEKVPPEVLKQVPFNAATYYNFVPIGLTDGVLEVGMVDPSSIEARDALQFITSRLGVPFKIFAISQGDFEAVIKGYEGLTTQVSKALGDLDAEIKAEEVEAKELSGRDTPAAQTAKVIEDAPVTRIVAVILQLATSGGASDIDIEPGDANLKVRFRVDGVLYTSLFLPINVHDAVVARIKILTNMKLDEKRKPQDGRFSARIDSRKIDFRVSTLPTYFGEKVVIRILDPERTILTLPALGLSPENLEIVNRAIRRPYGLILVTGPTGSGKTTTLYSMLRELDREKNNAVSLEDPIEYNIEGVNQSQVKPEIDYTFANGLRSILRQDPDIIMVGEIRDTETARLAVQASLTGHLVLATLHTNNAAGVIPRLVDMGLEPYLIAATLILAMGQRLVPVLCEDSREALPVEGAVKAMVENILNDVEPIARAKIVLPDKVYRAARSASCPSGTRGRIAAFEVLEVNREIEAIMLKSPTEEDIYKVARKNGFLTMKEDALMKAFQGTIPFEEVGKL